MTSEIPAALYTVIGALIVSNLGAIGALIVFTFKAGAFVTRTELGIKDAKERAERAHARLDKLGHHGVRG